MVFFKIAPVLKNLYGLVILTILSLPAVVWPANESAMPLHRFPFVIDGAGWGNRFFTANVSESASQCGPGSHGAILDGDGCDIVPGALDRGAAFPAPFDRFRHSVSGVTSGGWIPEPLDSTADIPVSMQGGYVRIHSGAR